jgi:hypothetical protein
VTDTIARGTRRYVSDAAAAQRLRAYADRFAGFRRVGQRALLSLNLSEGTAIAHESLDLKVATRRRGTPARLGLCARESAGHARPLDHYWRVIVPAQPPRRRSGVAERDLRFTLELAPGQVRRVDVHHHLDDALAVRLRVDDVAIPDEVADVTVRRSAGCRNAR